MSALSEDCRFVICISSEGYPASLEVRKVYATVPDQPAEKNGLIRVIDESGEDYLYPRARFAEITLSPEAEEAFGPPAAP